MEHPDDSAPAPRDRAVALTAAGDLLKSRGDLDGALQAYRDSLQAWRALAGADPDDAQWRREAALTAERIGAVLVMKSALAGRSEGDGRHDASWSLGTAGDVLAARGDRASALALYREGIRRRRALAAQHPENLALLHDVAWRLGTVGDVLAAQGDLEEALAAHREALDLRRALAARDAANPGTLRDLAWSLGVVGELLTARKDTAGALAAFREDAEVMGRLRVLDPSDQQLEHYLAAILAKIDGLVSAQH